MVAGIEAREVKYPERVWMADDKMPRTIYFLCSKSIEINKGEKKLSVVCAKVYKDKIVMAADSIAVRGWSKTVNEQAKIMEIEGMIVGYVGCASDGCLLFHYMRTHKPESGTEKAVIDFFVEFMKWKKDYKQDVEIPCCLFAYDSKLFRIEGMYIQEITEHCAIGAGMDFANAALYFGHTPREAVKAACDLSCMVAEPIVVIEMAK